MSEIGFFVFMAVCFVFAVVIGGGGGDGGRRSRIHA